MADHFLERTTIYCREDECNESFERAWASIGVSIFWESLSTLALVLVSQLLTSLTPCIRQKVGHFVDVCPMFYRRVFPSLSILFPTLFTFRAVLVWYKGEENLAIPTQPHTKAQVEKELMFTLQALFPEYVLFSGDRCLFVQSAAVISVSWYLLSNQTSTNLIRSATSCFMVSYQIWNYFEILRKPSKIGRIPSSLKNPKLLIFFSIFSIFILPEKAQATEFVK